MYYWGGDLGSSSPVPELLRHDINLVFAGRGPITAGSAAQALQSNKNDRIQEVFAEKNWLNSNSLANLVSLATLYEAQSKML